MGCTLVVTFTGPNRPGVVDRFSAVVEEHGGNWEDSRLATLGGRFAGIIEITLPEAAEAAMRAGLRALESEGIDVLIVRGSQDPRRAALRRRLVVTGADRPGIVHEIARVLASREVNIEELASTQFAAPMSGELMFRAQADLECPLASDLPELREAIEALGLDLHVELTPRAEDD